MSKDHKPSEPDIRNSSRVTQDSLVSEDSRGGIKKPSPNSFPNTETLNIEDLNTESSNIESLNISSPNIESPKSRAKWTHPFLEKSSHHVSHHDGESKGSLEVKAATPKKAKKPKSMQEGHRARLAQKFMLSQGDGMLDYEMLELLLGFAVPRKNMRIIARNMLEEFGSLGNILSAPADEITQVSGVGNSVAQLLSLVHHIGLRAHQTKIHMTNFMANHENVMSYLYLCLSNQTRESLVAIFVNNKGYIIKTEIVSKGTVDHLVVHEREIVAKALRYGATAILLAHNHPAQEVTPSKQDILVTRKLMKTLLPLGIYLIDHYIIARGKYFSMRSKGLLD